MISSYGRRHEDVIASTFDIQNELLLLLFVHGRNFVSTTENQTILLKPDR